MSAVEQWNERVGTHHGQSEAAMDQSKRPDDFWRGLAPSFRADPRRTDDVVLESIARHVTPDMTVLDVGGGAGRFALPLALRCAGATVVDPSPAMLDQLREAARETSVPNVGIVEGAWEEAEAEPADVVLCAHVVYGVADIQPFIRKLETHARKRVLILAFLDSPQAHLAPFWGPLHGEERVNLPALPELMGVLWAMGIFPDLQMVNAADPRGFQDREAALEQLTRSLYVYPDTPQDRMLPALLDDLLVPGSDGLVVKGSRRRREGLISWSPTA